MAAGGVLYRLRRNLADLLNPGEADAAPPPRIAPVSTQPAFGAATFENRLRDLFGQSGQASVLSGRINFIGLQKIKEQFGTAWERIAERADRIARNVIERHLTRGDIYTGIQGVTFVIVFGRLSQDQAQIKCRLIGEEIAKALLGEQGTELLEVKTAVARIDSRFSLEAVPTLEDLSQPMAASAGIGIGDDDATVPRGEPAAPGDRPHRPHFAYHAVWDQSRNVVSTYVCRPMALPASQPAGSNGAEEPVARSTQLARRDQALREHVLDDLAKVIGENRRLLLGLLVHFETLLSVACRREYVRELGERLGAEARQLLVIEIADIPSGVPQSRLVELVAPLRQYCRGVILRLPIETVDLTNVKGCGATAVGCDLTDHVGPDLALIQQMNRFSRAAEQAGLATYLLGAKSLSLVAAAVGAGFRYIGGDALAKPVDRPGDLVDFRLGDLYRPFIRA